MDFQAAEAYILQLLREGLSQSLTYHDVNHTLGVVRASLEIAREENILDERELLLLKTAALYHDCGFLHVYDHHEAEGCRIAREVLPGFGYSDQQIDIICGMIMKTMLPQQPETHLERIICDADLDHLGREDFHEIGDGLYREWLSIGKVHTKEEWNTIQIGFLEKHRYWTATEEQRRGILKEQHLQELRALNSVT